MSPPIDPDEVRETVADVVREAAAREAQDVVDGLRDLLGE